MVRDANKPCGRMPAYAFFVRTCREEHKKNHPDEAVVFAEFSKCCSVRWKTMNEVEKTRFHQMAEKDKERYDSEMANYKPSENEMLTKGGKRKRTKDPNAPKRSLSAFFWFSNHERFKVKATMPNSVVSDVARELGRRWREASPDVRAEYEALAAQDKARYMKDMTAYKSGGSVPNNKEARGDAGYSKAPVSDESGEEEEQEWIKEEYDDE